MKKILLFVLLIVGYNAFAQDGSVSEKSVKGSKVTVCSLEKVQKKETMPLTDWWRVALWSVFRL
jgi:hypothetical protein